MRVIVYPSKLLGEQIAPASKSSMQRACAAALLHKGKTIIHNNDYVLADIDGIVIIPSNIIENILDRAEKLINTENLVRKSIKEGMDPQEAYLKYSAF